MKNVHEILSSFEELCDSIPDRIKASNIKQDYFLKKLDMAYTTYRDRVKNPRLWNVVQLRTLAAIFEEEADFFGRKKKPQTGEQTEGKTPILTVQPAPPEIALNKH